MGVGILLLLPLPLRSSLFFFFFFFLVCPLRLQTGASTFAPSALNLGIVHALAAVAHTDAHLLLQRGPAAAYATVDAVAASEPPPAVVLPGAILTGLADAINLMLKRMVDDFAEADPNVWAFASTGHKGISLKLEVLSTEDFTVLKTVTSSSDSRRGCTESDHRGSIDCVFPFGARNISILQTLVQQSLHDSGEEGEEQQSGGGGGGGQAAPLLEQGTKFFMEMKPQVSRAVATLMPMQLQPLLIRCDACGSICTTKYLGSTIELPDFQVACNSSTNAIKVPIAGALALPQQDEIPMFNMMPDLSFEGQIELQRPSGRSFLKERLSIKIGRINLEEEEVERRLASRRLVN